MTNRVIDLSSNTPETDRLSFNSVSIKMTDALDGTANIELVFDPPLPETFNGTPMDFKEQPCSALAFYILDLLNNTGELSTVEDTLQ